MIVVGMYLFITGYVKSEHKTIMKAVPVFLIAVGCAVLLNELAYRSGLLERETFNMFFISPYCEPSLGVYALVQRAVPFPLCLLIYIIGFSLAAYLVFLAAFSTFSYGTNGIKAGAAAAIFLMALSFRKNLKVCIPLILISWGFHHSMIMPIVGLALTLVYKNSKIYFAGWCFCLLMAIAHITFFQELFGGILSDSGDSGANYLNEVNDEWGGKTGFRIDFVIYSAMPILVGYWAVYKKRLQLSKIYTCLLNLYMTLNGTWMLCMYANFTNRIAYLSWFLYPIVLIYPYLNENWGPTRYKDFSKVMLAHLGFTLFMKFIFYA
jgi:hypothetical protein